MEVEQGAGILPLRGNKASTPSVQSYDVNAIGVRV
jgi:hypothetical protein